MLNPDNKYFCSVPFVLLNTRGRGNARVCCNIEGLDYGIPKHLTVDEMSSDSYGPQAEVYDLSKDSIEDVWNSPFLKDFRMKMLKGEKISNCEFCYKAQEHNLSNKRSSQNKIFLKNLTPRLSSIYENAGKMNEKPVWWEIRLSTVCNLSCIMCSPGLSSRMRNEYENWENRLTDQMARALEISRGVTGRHLSESDFFKDQIYKNIENIKYLELRGGEVFSDKANIEFLERVTRSPHASNITLDVSTNGTCLDDKIISLLNCFKGGILKFSIDAYGKKDELIRYHTKWDHVQYGLEKGFELSSGWRLSSQTCIQSTNCVGLTDLLYFLDATAKEHPHKEFFLGFNPVHGRKWLKHDLISEDIRQQEIIRLKIFEQSSWLCNEASNKVFNRKEINNLKKILDFTQNTNTFLVKRAQSYFRKISELRKQNYLEFFPHLNTMKAEK